MSVRSHVVVSLRVQGDVKEREGEVGGTRQGVLSMCVYVCMCAGMCAGKSMCAGMCVEGGHVYMCVEGGKNDGAMRLKVYTALLLLTDGGYYSEIRHHVYIPICKY